MIRRASFTDLPQLILLAVEAHERSRYSDVHMDVACAERVVRQALMAPDKPAIGALACFVAEGGERIHGFLLGSMSRLYECLDVVIASDELFYVSKNGSPRMAAKLLNAFEQWAFQHPGRVIVRVTVNDAIVRPDRTAFWMSKRGYTHIGYAFEKEKLI